ncbi:hypothetical protein OPT61_g7766 [Boeremia exigua]|uniref:Uncharacterized protein n=1 Tax=Boeremia exigua TaxID=749465 RepID=A0ACC2I1B1_9PLEO|nr:hypothetical protein OPT61_g7766 [Boeremia exigua]
MLTTLTSETTETPQLNHSPINRSSRLMCSLVYQHRQADEVQKRVQPVQEGGDSPWLLGSAGNFAFQTTGRVQEIGDSPIRSSADIGREMRERAAPIVVNAGQ